MQKVELILQEIANGATIRKTHKQFKLNKETLSGSDVVGLSNIEALEGHSVEIRRSGTGLVIIVTHP